MQKLSTVQNEIIILNYGVCGGILCLGVAIPKIPLEGVSPGRGVCNNFRKSSESSSEEGEPSQPLENWSQKSNNREIDCKSKSQFIFLAPMKSTL